jgi:hypothetical protein
MADHLYRAEARRKHRGRWTSWQGKWRPDPQRAIDQGQRWRRKETFTTEISIVCTNGMTATLEELEQAKAAGKPR